MGCGYDILCKTCKKNYYLGYGSYSTWAAGAKNEEEYWERVAKCDARQEQGRESVAEIPKNKNILKVLREHEGHDLLYYNEDFSDVSNGDLMFEAGWGASEVAYANYDQVEQIDLTEEE